MLTMHSEKTLVHTVVAVMTLWIAKSNGCTSDVLVTQSTISRSWHSSSFNRYDAHQMCGFGSAINTAIGIESADQGFHWLVVQLVQPMVIAGVTMRSAGQSGSADDRLSQAEDIEVWTSSQEVNFGSETCSSRQISSIFDSTKSSWVMCGKTGKVDRSDGSVKAQCTSETNHMAHMVLLRKNIARISIPDRQCMSFSQLRLIAGPNVTIVIEPSVQVLQNSNVTVNCNVSHCADATSNISIYHSNENSVKMSKIGKSKQESMSYHIVSAQPSHSGKYTCVVGDKVLDTVALIVINPPKQLRISVHERSCNAQSPNVTFAFESSESLSMPHHQCTVSDSHDNHLMMIKSREDADTYSGGANSLRSLWVCQNCSSAGNVTVQCTAVLLHLNQSDGTAPGAGTVLWNSSALVSLNLNAELKQICSSNRITIAIGFSTFLLVAIIAILILIKHKQIRPTGLQCSQPALEIETPADPRPLPSTPSTGPHKLMRDEPPPTPPLRTQPTDGSSLSQELGQEFGTGSAYMTVMNSTTITKHSHAGKADPETDDKAVPLSCKTGSEITVYLEIRADGALEAE